MGISVSKKVGNAVVRNTVRRRLKEVFYDALPDIPPNLDLVFAARPAAAAAHFNELAAEFRKYLDKAKTNSARSKPEGRSAKLGRG